MPRWCVFIVIVVLLTVLVGSLPLNATAHEDELLHARYPSNSTINIAVYRGMWLLILFLLLLGVNIYVWDKYHMMYVFDHDLRNGMHCSTAFEAGSLLLIPWLIGLMIIAWVANTPMTIVGIPGDVYPLLVSMGFWTVLLCPFDVFYMKTRMWVIKQVAQAFVGPMVPVTFASFWLADQFTSLTIGLTDLETTFCHYSAVVGGTRCEDVNYFLHPALVSLPFVWRFMQCLRQYSDTGSKSHIWNAIKYLASLVVLFFSVMDHITRDKLHGEHEDLWTVYRTLWLMSIIVSSSYSYFWDIFMDWGLCKYSLKHFLLRDTLMFERTWLYYIAMITNLLMRLTWTLNISPLFFGITLPREILLCILSSVEVIRRIQWNFFRIENEHVSNLVKHKLAKQSNHSKNHVLKI